MQILAHAGVGWVLAEAGRGDRRFRQVVFLSALVPDLDGLSLLLGPEAFGRYHGCITHSVPFAILVSMMAAALCRQHRIKAAVFALLAALSHFLGDYFLSGWPMAPWFPFSRMEILSAQALWLWHPANHVLSAVAVAVMFWLSWRFQRTPLEVVSEGLDQRTCNFIFRVKPLSCEQCGRSTNERCSRCHKPVCVRHASLTHDFAPRCAQCRREGETE